MSKRHLSGIFMLENETFFCGFSYNLFWHSGFFETPDLILNRSSSSLFAKREKFWVNVYYAWNLPFETWHLVKVCNYSFLFFASCNLQGDGWQGQLWSSFLNCPLYFEKFLVPFKKRQLWLLIICLRVDENFYEFNVP